jgi:sulfur carrier protein ThiS
LKVQLHHPVREVSADGPVQARELCVRLGYNPESVLVLRDDALVVGDTVLDDGDVVEIIPAMSGG